MADKPIEELTTKELCEVADQLIKDGEKLEVVETLEKTLKL